ncbi:hypothetical protein NMK54_34365 [Nocardia otitidiscaviarum]|uniref:hypothetical protein n=1 Tax=Nocardia otitidiscaviarum TaxID=1823 RepID=UPI0020CBF8A7|nr:hypothetical protein [Nocardia otitidiscaviarum]MCP9625232.1 hypothetical protein [Nocardia otitidiscaviarum]
MEAKQCPRCGQSVESTTGRRGRPRVWCSARCRRLASEELRAARAGGRAIEVHEEIRERRVERSRPLSPDGAVDRVLSDSAATEKLMRVLAHRIRQDPPHSTRQAWSEEPMKRAIRDLWQAYHGAGGSLPDVPMPEIETKTTTATADAHRAAVALVLSSPRSTREVLAAVGNWARNGTLARSEHAATIKAAKVMLETLLAYRLLPRR